MRKGDKTIGKRLTVDVDAEQKIISAASSIPPPTDKLPPLGSLKLEDLYCAERLENLLPYIPPVRFVGFEDPADSRQEKTQEPVTSPEKLVGDSFKPLETISPYDAACSFLPMLSDYAETNRSTKSFPSPLFQESKFDADNIFLETFECELPAIDERTDSQKVAFTKFDPSSVFPSVLAADTATEAWIASAASPPCEALPLERDQQTASLSKSEVHVSTFQGGTAEELQVMSKYNLSNKQLDELRESFHYLAEPHRTLHKSKFGKSLRLIGQNPSRRDIRKMWQVAGARPGKECVTLDNYLRAVGCWGLKSEVEMFDDLIEALKVFDTEGQGFINAHKLSAYLTNVGETLQERDVERLFQMAGGVRDDGKVDLIGIVKSMAAQYK